MKKEQKQYSRLFGKHFFEDEAFFQVGGKENKYTLAPLKHLNRLSLSCSEVEGIKSVELLELQLVHEGPGSLREIYRSEINLLEHLNILADRLTGTVTIVRETFRLTFDGDLKSRCITVCTPNVTIYDRDVDGLLVDRWLKTRGFLIA